MTITLRSSSLFLCPCGVGELISNSFRRLVISEVNVNAATIYLELWKRRQASLAWEWDLMETEFGENKEVRPEYELAATDVRISPVTKQKEAYMPTWKKNVRFALSTAGVLFVVSSQSSSLFESKTKLSLIVQCLILLVAMFLVILYRLVVVTVFANLESKLLRTNARLIASVTAACVNLAITIIFKQVIFERFIEKLM